MAQRKTKAQDALISDMGRIRSYVNSFVFRGDNAKAAFDMEDLYQEAYLAYLEAYVKYDPECGTDPMTWAARPIRWSVNGFLRGKSVQGSYAESCLDADDGRKEKADAVSGDAAVRSIEDDAVSRMYVLQINRVLKDIYDHYEAKTYKYGVIAILSEENGAQKTETAERLGVTTSYLAVCKSRVRDLIAPMFETGNPMERFAVD